MEGGVMITVIAIDLLFPFSMLSFGANEFCLSSPYAEMAFLDYYLGDAKEYGRSATPDPKAYIHVLRLDQTGVG